METFLVLFLYLCPSPCHLETVLVLFLYLCPCIDLDCYLCPSLCLLETFLVLFLYLCPTPCLLETFLVLFLYLYLCPSPLCPCIDLDRRSLCLLETFLALLLDLCPNPSLCHLETILFFLGQLPDNRVDYLHIHAVEIEDSHLLAACNVLAMSHAANDHLEEDVGGDETREDALGSLLPPQ